MANKNILTSSARLTSVEQFYYSPSLVLPTEPNSAFLSIYCFLSKVDTWSDDLNPPQPTQDQRYIKNVFKNMFVAKHITSNQISPVIRRVDWTSGITYDYYHDDIDMFEKDDNGYNIYNYYVKNRYDQVFKCLWNNNDNPSTVEPYFEPGNYSQNKIFQGTDGYKWKFMYTIDTGSKVKFMDSTWMPVPVLRYAPNPLLSDVGFGGVEVINVTNSGNGYYTTNSVISVVISGDGSGATGTPVISNGQITDVVVTNQGSNYSYANVSIVATATIEGNPVGSGATVITDVSPVGGHAFDVTSELGCTNVMVTCEFNGSETVDGIDYIPTDIDFYQLGLLINPTTISLSPSAANGYIYKTTTDFILAPGVDIFENDEVIYQGGSLETATFTAKVLSFDTASNVLYLININGTPSLNSTVHGNTSKATRTLLNFSSPDFVLHSGYMSYIENRSGIQRSVDGIEQVKIVLGY